ncbi:MAG TPA: hypothetical protein VMA55_13530 [Acidovorax sp.]|nr:hypothetical protein [Acidovorax sp.]
MAVEADGPSSELRQIAATLAAAVIPMIQPSAPSSGDRHRDAAKHAVNTYRAILQELKK